MSINIIQTPPFVNLAQSPIVFSVIETSSVLLQNDGFQYVGNLYYWTGSYTASGSLVDYTLTKYPNVSLYGIFDISRIINSTLQDLAQANTSNAVYFAVDFYSQWLTGSVYVTGSHTKSETYRALDGYSIFQEPISQSITEKTPHWPIMTDGPATQSAFLTNKGTMGVFGATQNIAGGLFPDNIYYTSGTQTAQYLLSGSAFQSNTQIQQFPIGPSQPGFPLTGSISEFKIQARLMNLNIGAPITFNIVCNQKYPNVRIKWKNRYGQFDWFNFNMVNRQSFNTERRTYQPQLGTWQSPTLTYNNYDSSVLNYIADSKQAISVNTDWVDEAYNEIFKQLLVSDEIYWIYDEGTNPVQLRPITIRTDSITFKTGVVDKVIQYSFDFNWGQAYKLII